MLTWRTGKRPWQRFALLQMTKGFQTCVRPWVTVLKSNRSPKEMPAFAFWQDQSLKKLFPSGSMSCSSKKPLVRLKGPMGRPFQFMPEACRASSKRSRSFEKSPISETLNCQKRRIGNLINCTASTSNMQTSLLHTVNFQRLNDISI